MTVTASRYERRPFDLYETESWATRALLNHLPVGGMTVWESAAGDHAIADVLREAGAEVITSDIATYNRRHDAIVDFLEKRFAYKNPAHDAIITNPPYGRGNHDAVKFARLSLERCNGWVALLLTAKFDFGKTRADLFRDNPRFYAKIALTDRISWFDGRTGTEDNCWMIWGPVSGAPYQPKMLWEGKGK
jgi:hypothetical protein